MVIAAFSIAETNEVLGRCRPIGRQRAGHRLVGGAERIGGGGGGDNGVVVDMEGGASDTRRLLHANFTCGRFAVR